MKPFRLYALPSIWSGTARLVDLGGVFDRYNYSSSNEEADQRALASDWAQVGHDLYLAARRVVKSLGTTRG